MLLFCFYALLHVLPALAILALLRTRLIPVRFQAHPFLLACCEAFLWVVAVQCLAEISLLNRAAAHITEGAFQQAEPSATGILLRLFIAVPVFFLPRTLPARPSVGVLVTLLWAAVFSQPTLMQLSTGVAVHAPLASVDFGLLMVTPITFTYFLIGALWYLIVQRLQGQLQAILPVSRLFGDWKAPHAEHVALWLELFLLYGFLAFGLILASAGLLSSPAVRVQHYGMVLAFNFACMLLCFWLLWRGNGQIRVLLSERERNAQHQISTLERNLFMRQQQICRMLSGAGAGAVFWSARHAHVEAGSQDWRGGVLDVRMGALDFPLEIRPSDNLEIFFRKCLRVDQFKRLEAALDSIFKGPETQFVIEVDGVLSQKGQHMYKVYANALKSDKGPGVLFCDILVIDFNPERAVRRQLQTAAEVRKETLFSVGHDLGSPMGLVRISASLLRRHLEKSTALDDYTRKQLARIDACVLEANSYLKNALDFAQSDQPDHRFPSMDIQPYAWLRTLLDNQMAIYGIDSHRVELDVPADLVLHAVQEQAFQMVATNLVSNAFKYGAQGGGRIKVALSEGRDAQSRSGAILHVIDEGRGIPESVRDSLYTPFTRGSHTGHLPGTGLGLSIVRRGVNCLGGHIELMSVQRGTHFRVWFPVSLSRLQAKVPA